MLEPRNRNDDAIILEFKVQEMDEEKELSNTVNAALKQIEEKNMKPRSLQKGFQEKRSGNMVSLSVGRKC